MTGNPAEFVISYTFDAPRDVVFDAWTDEKQLDQWWGPKGAVITHSEMDFREGGSYLYAMKYEGFEMWGKFVYRTLQLSQLPDILARSALLTASVLIIIGLSADTKGSLSAKFIKQGADDFLRKPFCPEELNCRVMSTLERRDMLQALKQAALFDSLTGLYNRRAFYEQGIQRFQQALNGGQSLSVAMLDLDFFKSINDNYGHASGDTALIGFASCLRTAFPDALVGRLGGEEFAMISNLDGPRLAARLDQLRSACTQIRYAADAPPLSFSAGVYHGTPDDLESLLHHADMHLYQAKNSGRGRTLHN